MATEQEVTEVVLDENQAKLPSGIVVSFNKWKARDVLNMRKVIKGDDEDSAIFAMVSAICSFDGAKMIMEDVAEMDGWDFIALQGELEKRGGFQLNPDK